jgi:hypothetical protein
MQNLERSGGDRESHRKRSVRLLVAEAKIEAHGHWINLKIIKS